MVFPNSIHDKAFIKTQTHTQTLYIFGISNIVLDSQTNQFYPIDCKQNNFATSFNHNKACFLHYVPYPWANAFLYVSDLADVSDIWGFWVQGSVDFVRFVFM